GPPAPPAAVRRAAPAGSCPTRRTARRSARAPSPPAPHPNRGPAGIASDHAPRATPRASRPPGHRAPRAAALRARPIASGRTFAAPDPETAARAPPQPSTIEIALLPYAAQTTARRSVRQLAV